MFATAPTTVVRRYIVYTELGEISLFVVILTVTGDADGCTDGQTRAAH
jgi:hypothetical protein